MPCYRIQYSKSVRPTYEADILRCVSYCVYNSSGSSQGNGPWLDCPDLGWDRFTAWVTTGAVSIVGGCSAACTGDTPPGFSIAAGQAYDGLNGGCIPKTTYNTPGFYANLASCQSGCARNSNCRGECVSPEQMAALKQAANQLQAKICN